MSTAINTAAILDDLAKAADAEAAATVDQSVHRASRLFQLADHLRTRSMQTLAGEVDLDDALESVAAARWILAPRSALRAQVSTNHAASALLVRDRQLAEREL